MKLQYLGTAAAEGVPAPFCLCDTCKRSMELGGRNIRSRSQALVNDKLLIDFSCDTFYHSVLNRIDMTKIRSCIITHVHEDHLYTKELFYFYPGYNQIPEGYPPFVIYGSRETGELVTPYLEKSVGRLAFVELQPFETVEIEGMQVTPLKASHGTQMPFVYAIESGGKRMLYAHDTDILPQESMDFLLKTGWKFDYLSLDCTEGGKVMPYRGAHMCLSIAKEFWQLMKDKGLADENTKACLNHFSHNGHAVYEDFVPAAAAEGFLVSYDGMTVEI